MTKSIRSVWEAWLIHVPGKDKLRWYLRFTIYIFQGFWSLIAYVFCLDDIISVNCFNHSRNCQWMFVFPRCATVTFKYYICNVERQTQKLVPIWICFPEILNIQKLKSLYLQGALCECILLCTSKTQPRK